MENLEEIIVAYDPEVSWAGKIIKRISDTPIRIHRKGFLALQKHFANKVYNYKMDAEEEKVKIGELAKDIENSENKVESALNRYILKRHIQKYTRFEEKAASYNDLLMNPIDLDNSAEEIKEELASSFDEDTTNNADTVDLSTLPEIDLDKTEETIEETENVEKSEVEETEKIDDVSFDDIYPQILVLLESNPELKENLEALLSLTEEEKKMETLSNFIEDNVAFEVENAKIYALLDGCTEEEMIEQMNNATSLDKTEENETVSEELSGIDETAEESFENGEGFIPEEIENPETEIVDGEQAIEETTVDDAELEQSQSEDEFEKPEVEQPQLEGFEEAMQEAEQATEEGEIQEEYSPVVDSDTLLHGNNFYGSNFEEDINNPNEKPEDIEWLVNEVNKAYEEEYQQELTERISQAEEALNTDDLGEERIQKIEDSVEESLHNKYEISEIVDEYKNELIMQGFNEDTEENKANLQYILGLKRELEEEKRLTGENSERVRELEQVLRERVIGLKPESVELEQVNFEENIDNYEENSEIEIPEVSEEMEQDVITDNETLIKAEYEEKLALAHQAVEEAEKRAEAAEKAECAADEQKKKARKEKNQVKDELKKTNREYSKTLEEKNRYKAQTEELKTENAKLTSDLYSAVKRAESAENRVILLEEQLSNKESRISQLEADLSSANKKVDKVTKQLEKMVKVLGLDKVMEEETAEYTYEEESSKKM